MSERRTSFLAATALLMLAAAWGSTFFLIKDLLDRVPTLDFLAVRFTIAAVAMLVVAPRALSRLSPVVRRHSVVLGVLYGLAQILQTAGLAHTPASISGFVTGLYVVFTPLLAALILRTRIPLMTWAAVVVAMIGLGVLALNGVSIGYGELITLASAALYALHIVGLGAWSTASDALGMTILQVIAIAVVCSLATAPDGIVLPQRAGDWASVIYMGIVVGALGLFLQTWAQAYLPPTRSAIIMSMEPVFASLFAVTLGGEHLTSRLLIGGTLVLVAMLTVELSPRRVLEGEVTHIVV